MVPERRWQTKTYFNFLGSFVKKNKYTKCSQDLETETLPLKQQHSIPFHYLYLTTE